jgi:hypothetical protein
MVSSLNWVWPRGISADLEAFSFERNLAKTCCFVTSGRLWIQSLVSSSFKWGLDWQSGNSGSGQGVRVGKKARRVVLSSPQTTSLSPKFTAQIPHRKRPFIVPHKARTQTF